MGNRCLGKEENMNDFLTDENGASVVEVILILVILIAIVLIFKDKISAIVEKAFKNIKGDSDSIIA